MESGTLASRSLHPLKRDSYESVLRDRAGNQYRLNPDLVKVGISFLFILVGVFMLATLAR